MSKWAGIKTKEIRIRLTDEQNLPSVVEARIRIAKDMTVRLNTQFQEQANAFESRVVQLEQTATILSLASAARRSLPREHGLVYFS